VIKEKYVQIPEEEYLCFKQIELEHTELLKDNEAMQKEIKYLQADISYFRSCI